MVLNVPPIIMKVQGTNYGSDIKPAMIAANFNFYAL